MADVPKGSLDDLVCWCSGRGCPIDLPTRLMPLMDELEAVRRCPLAGPQTGAHRCPPPPPLTIPQMIDDTIKDFDPAHVRQFLKRDLDGVVIVTLSERMKAVRCPPSRPSYPLPLSPTSPPNTVATCTRRAAQPLPAQVQVRPHGHEARRRRRDPGAGYHSPTCVATTMQFFDRLLPLQTGQIPSPAVGARAGDIH